MNMMITEQLQKSEPLEILPPPKFPTVNKIAFHGIAGEIVELATKDSEADKAAVLISLLSGISVLFGGDKFLPVGETKSPARLFTALVGNSSRARKGTSLKPIKRILEKTEEMIREKNPEYTLLNIGDGGFSSAEGLIWTVRDESEQTDKNGEPMWEGVHDKRLWIIEEELGNVLRMMQREGNTLSPMLRRAWDGGILAPMTKNNRLSASYPHIGILSHITRQELTALLSGTDIKNGLVNRFLWCCVRRSKIVPFPKPMDDFSVIQISQKIADNYQKTADKKQITLSNDARQLWTELYKSVSVDYKGVIGDATARAEAQLLRLALIYCLLDGVTEISTEHINAGVAVWDYCKESVVYLFSFDDPEERDPDTDKLMTALKQKPLSQTEISALFGRNKTAKQLNRFLSDLEGANQIQQKAIKTSGRSKILWTIVN